MNEDSLFQTGVRPLVDEFLLKESEKVRDYGDYWSASSAGYCMRKVIFDRLKVPHVNPDARKQRLFSSGHIFHEWMQGLTKAAGLSVASEEELKDEGLMVIGHFDDIIKTETGLILYDYKTVNSHSFTHKKDRLSRYHTMQLGTYLYMLRKLKPYKDLTEARILNISKDDLRMGEQQLLWSPALEKMVFEYWSTLNGYWKNKQIPKCTCADYEINQKTGLGFMADARYNPYFFDGEPCSLKWLMKCKEEGLVEWK